SAARSRRTSASCASTASAARPTYCAPPAATPTTRVWSPAFACGFERDASEDAMSTVFAWIESTALATTIAGSLALTATLSAIHLLGFTLVMGSALVGNLKRLGLLLPQSSIVAVLRPANRAI